MSREAPATLLPARIESRILVVRGHRILLDADLAALYEVETRVLVQAVKRNIARFPKDFMFQRSAAEWQTLKSQSVMSKMGRGGRRTALIHLPNRGVAMLSSVLGSARAIAVNIEVVRTFVRIRTLVNTQHDLAKQLDALEEKTEVLAMRHETFARNTRIQLKQVFEAIRLLTTPPDEPRRPIGFVAPEEKGALKKPRNKRGSDR